MKVIAKTETGYLLESTTSELPSLLGYNSFYSTGNTVSEKDVKIGYEFDLKRIIQLGQLVRDLNPETLKKIHKKLCDAQQELELMQELANSLVLFDILKDQSK